MKKIAIIGGGVSGLEASRILSQKKDFSVTLFEKSDRVGGRLKTQKEEGFLFDEGFQVFLPGYPSTKNSFHSLKLYNFEPGAMIWHNKSFYEISDPIRRPLELFNTIFSPIGNLKDKLKILALKSHCSKYKDDVLSDFNSVPKESALTFLKSFGFSESMIQMFFRPFFSGIFLENELRTESHYFKFLFNVFSNCYATLPQNGIEDVALNVYNRIDFDNFNLVTNKEIKSVNELSEFDHILSSSYQLLESAPLSINWRAVTTYYYTLKRFPFDKGILFLNGDGAGPVNHVAPLSLVNSNYSPEGYELISVNVLGEKINEEDVKDHLKFIFGEQVESWSFLKSIEVKHALPDNPSYSSEGLSFDNITLIGDYMRSSSVHGALKSGEKAALSLS